MPFLSKEIHDEHLKGYVITDCAVRDHNIVYFCLRKNVSEAGASMMWDHDIETLFLALFLSEDADWLQQAQGWACLAAQSTRAPRRKKSRRASQCHWRW